jgi:hypothetical protein
MIVLINHGSRSVLMSFIEKALSQEIIIKQYQYIGRRSIYIILLLQISTTNQHKITSSNDHFMIEFIVGHSLQLRIKQQVIIHIKSF